MPYRFGSHSALFRLFLLLLLQALHHFQDIVHAAFATQGGECIQHFVQHLVAYGSLVGVDDRRTLNGSLGLFQRGGFLLSSGLAAARRFAVL